MKHLRISRGLSMLKMEERFGLSRLQVKAFDEGKLSPKLYDEIIKSLFDMPLLCVDGEFLKCMRESLGLSQQNLSDMTGICRTHISKIERYYTIDERYSENSERIYKVLSDYENQKKWK